MKWNLDELKNKVEELLPARRFSHCVGVMEEAVRLSRLWGADEEKAAVAGLLHDVTKAKKKDEQLKLCEKFGIILNIVENNEEKLLHALTGAGFVKYEMGIDDPEIIDAIRYHTTARADMTLLDIVIYLADFTEPGRTYRGVEAVRRAVSKGPLEGLSYALDFSIFEVVKKGSMLHPDTVEARNSLVDKKEAGFLK